MASKQVMLSNNSHPCVAIEELYCLIHINLTKLSEAQSCFDLKKISYGTIKSI